MKKNTSGKEANTKAKVSKAAVKPKKSVATPHIPQKLEVKLIKYEMMAVIPTMMYGNITPRITVEARTMQEAREAVMLHIEELYQTYCEEPRDGRKPAFMSKAKVTATEKIVPQGPTGIAVAPAAAVAPKAPEAPAPAAQAPVDEDAPAPKTAAYLKAEGAVKAAMSREALDMIEDQIQKSERLTKEEKPLLLTDVLNKRKEFN